MHHGLPPSTVVLPQTWDFLNQKVPQGASEAHGLLLFLQQRFSHVSPAEWLARIEAGQVWRSDGRPITPTSPFEGGLRLHYFRAVERECAPPEDEVILHQDTHLLVADKPHGMAVAPTGKHLHETLLVRLRRRTGLAELAPVHRIDRDTAGLVLFAVSRAARGPYQALFRDRAVAKTYEAIAPFDPKLALPLERRSRIVPSAHFMQMQESDGIANTHTRIELLARLLPKLGTVASADPQTTSTPLARYALYPSTGKRHQLRVHMQALGLPILHDGIYPTLLPEGAVDGLPPLQLLARRVAFTDPFTGKEQVFESHRSLLF